MYKHNCIEEERRQQSQFNAEGAERRRARSRPMQARSRPMRRAQTSAQSSDADDTHESSQAIVTDEQSTACTDDTDEQAQQSHARTTDPTRP